VNVLEYRAPEILTDLLRKVTNNTSGFRVFDAGCGTGLCGPLLRDISIVLDGVDISPKMVEKAREKGVYDNLIVGELTKTLLDNKDSYDIVVSTDVFIYIGDLTEVFKAAYNSLKKGGLFGFSTETSTGTGFIIRPTGRFAHSAYYIKELAFDTGFILESSQDCALRKEYASVINGTVYLLRKA